MTAKKKVSKELAPLTPPDYFQCQAEKSNGVNFMTLGGRREMVRCTKTPTMVAEEAQPGKDGRIGSMSLCDECFGVAQKQMKGVIYTRIEPVMLKPKKAKPIPAIRLKVPR